jgi:hypothetical protein
LFSVIKVEDPLETFSESLGSLLLVTRGRRFLRDRQIVV